MNKDVYKNLFSSERMNKYFSKYPNSELYAIVHYHINIQLAEAFYPSLAMFEIALRNSIDRQLNEYFGEEWYLKFDSISGLKNLNRDLILAQKHIIKRNEKVTADKVVAELTLGFWVKLLNAEYELIL